MAQVMTAPAPARSRSATSPTRAGVADVLPVVLSVAPFAVVIGVAIARSRAVTGPLGLVAGAGYYSGSAQLASIDLLSSGAGVGAVLVTTLLINARLMVYGAALQPRFREQPTWFRWLAPHFVIDQTYALSSVRTDLADPRRFRRYWAALGTTLGTGWLLAMSAGVVLGPVLPDIAALDFAVPAIFLALLVPQLAASAARRPAALAALVAVVASPLPNGLGLLLGVIAGLLPSLLTDRSSS